MFDKQRRGNAVSASGRAPFRPALVLAVLLGSPWSATAYGGNHSPPDLDGFLLTTAEDGDGDCDGTFDELFGLNDQFHVPDCLK